jgi:uncharacterized membrane protein YoaT (DUF817 family)
MMEKTKLACELEKAVTWIWLEEDQLKAEFYDFSETAQRMFGNDIAHTLTVTDMKKLNLLTKQDEISLLKWMAENFKSYFGIKQWLEKNEIDFRVEIESWA